MEKFNFETSDKIRLTGIWHFPRTEADKVVILAHGITVDKNEDRAFINLANVLTKKGFAVLRFDFRCHGESGGKQIDFTITGQLKDLEAAVNQAVNKGYKKIHLLGASFGGGAASIFAVKNQSKLLSLCLWNPVLNYRHTFINPTLPWIIEKVDQMKKDIEKKGWTIFGSRKFILGKNIYQEMMKIKPYEALKKINIPTLIIHGTKDTKVPYKDSSSYEKLLTNGRLFSIENAGHGFHKDWEYKKAEKETLKFLLNI